MITRALTIAGSDSGGGAGIQADLKTFAVFGVYGTSAITALTAQNTIGVSGVHAVPAAFVRQQIEAVVSDIGVNAAKTGMLADAAIIAAVAAAVRQWRIEQLVVDPVMSAHTGAALLADDARELLLAQLIPLARVVTPNTIEAAALTGLPVTTIDEMRAAAAALIARGARAVLVKGGHLAGDAARADVVIDIFDDGKRVRELHAPRLATPHTHGTGCQLSAAIAANLALGHTLDDAVEIAKRFITAAIRGGLAVGHGRGPANPLAWLEHDPPAH
ncbi:MAG: bifunctional hydroxymethylpyrimidine kinase/phosphomethylpyrimidine kinase [Deltaproteobacteria bacterium]|nr:bifunctional hydroxymethylpyrimidine kinase/phosphomethylpyrimidine kinase [Deltaproteobacteria bacterium]